MKLYIFSILVLLSSHVSSEEKKPNIVLIFADDAGYADFSFQGSKSFITPAIDKLASQGVKFTQAYMTASVCGPSRAGLITGKYQQKFGFEENNVPTSMSFSALTGDEMGLPLQEKTLADYLKTKGYTSAIFGKWHLGNADKYHPLKRGFDEFYGFRDGGRDYFALKDEKATKYPRKKLERGFKNYEESDGYMTDVLAKEVNHFIDRNKNNPFFAFVSFNAVHAPLQAEGNDLAALDKLKGSKTLRGKRKTLAAMNLALDRAVAAIMQKLDDLHLSDNTLVVFTNDNGGPTDATSAYNYPLSGTKGTLLEGGIRVPFIIRWPTKIVAGTQFNDPVSSLDLLPTFYTAAGGDASTLADVDGVDLLPFLNGQSNAKPHEALYWKKEVRAAIREGDWKLLRFPDRPAELYNLSVDKSETNNLANEQPELVKKLFKQLFRWELTLERPLWQLKRKYEKNVARRTDNYRMLQVD